MTFVLLEVEAFGPDVFEPALRDAMDLVKEGLAREDGIDVTATYRSNGNRARTRVIVTNNPALITDSTAAPAPSNSNPSQTNGS